MMLYHITNGTRVYRYDETDRLWYPFHTRRPVTYDEADLIVQYDPQSTADHVPWPTPIQHFLHITNTIREVHWLFFALPRAQAKPYTYIVVDLEHVASFESLQP